MYSSIRGEMLYEAIQDMKLCAAVEAKIGRDNVVNLIDEEAGISIRFDDYPRDSNYLLRLREKLMQILATN